MIASTSARTSTTPWRRCIGRKTGVCKKLGDERLKGTQRLFGSDPDHLGEEQAVKFAELKGSDFKERTGLGDEGSVPTLLVLQR